MLAGGISVFVWKLLLKPLGGIFGIYELLPAFILSCLAIVIVSLMSKEPSQAIQHEFDHYMDEELVDRHLDAVLEGGIPLKGVNMPVDTPIHPNEAKEVDEKEPVTFKENVTADAHGKTLTRSAEAEGKKVEETITIEEKPE